MLAKLVELTWVEGVNDFLHDIDEIALGVLYNSKMGKLG